MATGMFFRITDGTTSCIFADGNDPPGANNYAISSDAWAPAVAGLLTSQLGGRGPYADVVETIPINVLGSTVPTLLANAQTLERLIQQAERWARGDNVAPVLVQYSPRGATASTAGAPLQAVILGRDPSASGTNAPSAVMLPQTFDREIGGLIIADGTLTFLRRGAWLLSTPVTGTSAFLDNPGPFPITGMTTHPNLSPCKVALDLNEYLTAPDFADSKPIFLIAQQASDMQFAEAEAGTATAYTSVADTANLACSGAVLRYTPTGTTEALSGKIDLSSMTASARRFAFFAAIRNNSATTTFNVRVAALVQVKTGAPTIESIITYTRPASIDTTHTRPRFVPLGIVSLPAPNKLNCAQLAITASAASGSIDIDYIIALAIDNPYAKAIQLNQAEAGGLCTYAEYFKIVINPQPLTGLAPSVYRLRGGASGDTDQLGYYGDAYPVASGTTCMMAIMAKTLGATAYWRYSSGGNVVSMTAICDRMNAYLTPE